MCPAPPGDGAPPCPRCTPAEVAEAGSAAEADTAAEPVTDPALPAGEVVVGGSQSRRYREVVLPSPAAPHPATTPVAPTVTRAPNVVPRAPVRRVLLLRWPAPATAVPAGTDGSGFDGTVDTLLPR